MEKPRIVLAGAQSGAGKTSICSALMAALVAQGHQVGPFKVGPDYIDPAFQEFAAGRPSYNLDSWLVNPETLTGLFLKRAPEAENGLAVIEGVMGLYDGRHTTSEGSTAEVAKILKAPVILIVSGAGLSRSAAAVVWGFKNFDPDLNLAGVIVNQVSGFKHYQLIKEIIETQAGTPCFGYLPKNPRFRLESRHLGLVPRQEVADIQGRLDLLSQTAQETLDIPGLLEVARSAPALRPARLLTGRFKPGARIRLGWASDKAFTFYYRENLALLEELGAELAPFSPLSDPALPPDLDGIYLGGGFPEVFAAELAANETLKAELKAALENGLPAYAECGGLIYLTSSVTDFEGRRHPMVGFFPQRAEMTRRLQNFGYVEITFKQDTVLGPAGTAIRGHEFHHSRLLDERPETGSAVLEMFKPGRNDSWTGGLARREVLAAYPHIHFYNQPALAANFLNRCRAWQKTRGRGSN